MEIIQEYPKYIQLEHEKFVIVEDEKEEKLYIKTKEEKNEPTSKNISKGTNQKKSNASGSIG